MENNNDEEMIEYIRILNDISNTISSARDDLKKAKSIYTENGIHCSLDTMMDESVPLLDNKLAKANNLINQTVNQIKNDSVNRHKINSSSSNYKTIDKNNVDISINNQTNEINQSKVSEKEDIDLNKAAIASSMVVGLGTATMIGKGVKETEKDDNKDEKQKENPVKKQLDEKWMY